MEEGVQRERVCKTRREDRSERLDGKYTGVEEGGGRENLENI